MEKQNEMLKNDTQEFFLFELFLYLWERIEFAK